MRLATVPGVALISVAATLWGLDALIRKPLAASTAPTTIVFGEHVILVALTLPLVLPALHGLWRAGPAYSRGRYDGDPVSHALPSYGDHAGTTATVVWSHE